MASARQRKIALCINNWGSEESIYAWKWMKQHLLKGPQAGHNDQLYIVHVIRGKEKERWDLGGPVVPDVRTAVAGINATIKEIEPEATRFPTLPTVIDAGAAITEFAAKENIDIVVLCSRGRGAVPRLMLGSVTETVINRVQCACLVIRPQVAAGDSLRMKSAVFSDGTLPMTSSPPLGSPLARTATMPSTTLNRRVAVAYDASALGQYLLQWAQQHVANPDDAIYVVRNVPKTRNAPSVSLDRQSVQRLAADVLAGHKQVFSFSLQGNSKTTIPSFVENEGIDLLVLGAYKEKAKPVFGTRQLALTIYKRCNCPVLIVPLKQQQVQQISQQVADELGSDDSSDDEPIPEDETGEAAAASTEPAPAARMSKQHSRRRSADAVETPPASSPKRSSSIEMRTALAAQLQEMALPAGVYLVEVGETGQVRSVRLQPSARPSSAPGTASPLPATAAAAATAAATAARGGSPSSSKPTLTGRDSFKFDQPAAAAAVVSEQEASPSSRQASPIMSPKQMSPRVPAAAAGPATDSASLQAAALRKVLDEKEAELAAVKQQLAALQQQQVAQEQQQQGSSKEEGGAAGSGARKSDGA